MGVLNGSQQEPWAAYWLRERKKYDDPQQQRPAGPSGVVDHAALKPYDGLSVPDILDEK